MNANLQVNPVDAAFNAKDGIDLTLKFKLYFYLIINIMLSNNSKFKACNISQALNILYPYRLVVLVFRQCV